MKQQNYYARKHGIPKAFRQYSKRYGQGPDAMVNMQKRIPADTLDHGRDRERARTVIDYPGYAT